MKTTKALPKGGQNPKWQTQSDEADSPTQATQTAATAPVQVVEANAPPATAVAPAQPAVTATVDSATSELVAAARDVNRLFLQLSGEDKQAIATASMLIPRALRFYRLFRDTGAYKVGGFNTFRAWCVTSMGERSGTAFEEIL